MYQIIEVSDRESLVVADDRIVGTLVRLRRRRLGKVARTRVEAIPTHAGRRQFRTATLAAGWLVRQDRSFRSLAR